jgi:transaldolase
MVSKLDQLKSMTTIVADTGDMESIRAYKPTDCTTNPTLILKAAQMPAYQDIVEEAVQWGRKTHAPISHITDRLAVSFGTQLAAIVPGRVSTEVDADLSFDTQAMIEKAKNIIADYEARKVSRERILIKLASTWEGISAARELKKLSIDCNMTLLFGMPQAIACAQIGAYLISPFVGRILDWYMKAEGKTYTAQTDPGVISVQTIYNFYKRHGIETIVMGASFRNQGEIEALAGCDRLTIAPQWLEQLANDNGHLTRQLSASSSPSPQPFTHLDEKAFRYALNEDAMATEKLAEGIRIFAKDLQSLRDMVTKHMAAG